MKCVRSQAMLKKKLQMKSEALMLLSQEMDQCRTQRDQFKLMAEQIQERFLHLKKQMCDMKELNRYLIQVYNIIVLLQDCSMILSLA